MLRVSVSRPSANSRIVALLKMKTEDWFTVMLPMVGMLVLMWSDRICDSLIEFFQRLMMDQNWFKSPKKPLDRALTAAGPAKATAE